MHMTSAPNIYLTKPWYSGTQRLKNTAVIIQSLRNYGQQRLQNLDFYKPRGIHVIFNLSCGQYIKVAEPWYSGPQIWYKCEKNYVDPWLSNLIRLPRYKVKQWLPNYLVITLDRYNVYTATLHWMWVLHYIQQERDLAI